VCIEEIFSLSERERNGERESKKREAEKSKRSKIIRSLFEE
jgi:hypothetical protein